VSVRKPGKELLALLAERDPAVAKLALALRALILERAPAARETVYDAGYTVAVHFSLTDRWQDAFCYVAVYSRHVNLGFNRGAELPDPGRRLRGTGKRMRHLKVRTEDDLREQFLRDLVDATTAKAEQAERPGAPSE
jgi:hypothetical protein